MENIWMPRDSRQSQQKYGFYSVESKLLQMPTQGAVYLNVEFTECEIVKLNQMKSWLVSAGGDWSCLIVPRLEMFCPQQAQHRAESNTPTFGIKLLQLDYSNSYRSHSLSLRYWMVERKISSWYLWHFLWLHVRLPGQDVRFALSSAHYIGVRFLPSAQPS